MGPSIELKNGVRKLKGDYPISWMYVPETVRQELIVKLNPYSFVSGNDWRMLACKLGLSQAQILFIESEKDTNTSCLFRMYDERPDASLNEIYKFLEEMKRTDCLEIIDKAYPEIYRKANESSDQSHEGQYTWATTPCNNGYPSMTSPGCISHSNCACHFPRCPSMVNHGHQVGVPPSNYHYQTQTHHHNTGCQAVNRSPIHEQVCNFSPLASPPDSAKCCCSSPRLQHISSSPSSVLRRPQHFPDNQAYVHGGQSSFNLEYHSVSVPLPNNISLSNNNSPDSNNDSMMARQKMARQCSDECIESQGSFGDKRLKQSNQSNVGDAADQHEFLPQPLGNRNDFRNTKVFVTYSYDDENHGKQLLSLCDFLKSNGFAVCADYTPPCIEWSRKRINEADFILVCVSPKYIQDISNKTPPIAAQSTGRHLHAWEIFDFLRIEYFENCRNGPATNGQSAQPSRVVPLLFGSMQADSLPQWMTRNRPSYVWPKDYLDLAWMLTNPQKRIKSRRHNTEEGMEVNHMSNAVSQGRDYFYKGAIHK